MCGQISTKTVILCRSPSSANLHQTQGLHWVYLANNPLVSWNPGIFHGLSSRFVCDALFLAQNEKLPMEVVRHPQPCCESWHLIEPISPLADCSICTPLAFLPGGAHVRPALLLWQKSLPLHCFYSTAFLFFWTAHFRYSLSISKNCHLVSPALTPSQTLFLLLCISSNLLLLPCSVNQSLLANCCFHLIQVHLSQHSLYRPEKKNKLLMLP